MSTQHSAEEQLQQKVGERDGGGLREGEGGGEGIPEKKSRAQKRKVRKS